MIITIDGPVATGKSTIAKQLAQKLGFIYYDTGAMYRCMTYALIAEKVDLDDLEQVRHCLAKFQFVMAVQMGVKHYFVGHEDVTDQIRQEKVTSLVSKVSAIGIVRDKLVALQRSCAEGVNAVFEGRDMGTVVFPNAKLKIFLFGRPEIRAKRRFDELRAKFPDETKNLTLEEALVDVNRRDMLDSSREISPLKQAHDAILVDTSDLSIDQVVCKIMDLIN